MTHRQPVSLVPVEHYFCLCGDVFARFGNSIAVPAVNVVATAQVLVCMYASLIGHSVDGGRHLLEPASVVEATSLHFEGIDEVALAPIKLGH